MFSFVVIILSTLALCLLVAFCWIGRLSWWLLILPVVGLVSFYLFQALYFGLLGLTGLFVTKKKEYRERSPFYAWVQTRMIEILCIFFKLRIHVSGKEIVPREGSFYLVGNHQSIFDPMLTYMFLHDRRFAFISKPENFAMPLLGRIIHRNLFLPIDRDNNRHALLTMAKATEMLTKRNYSIGIYPEGHRNNTDELLLPFHVGSFRVPIKANVPVLIAVTDGAKNVEKKQLWRTTHVQFRFVELVEAGSFNDNQSLCDYCRKRIADDLLAHS